MENKSRVIKYQELRNKISQMEVYSFTQQEELGKNEPIFEDETSHRKLEGVKKNTLSVSLDELMAQKDSLQEEKEKKETKQLYREKKKESMENHLTKGKVILLVSVPCVLILILFLVLILTKVI